MLLKRHKKRQQQKQRLSQQSPSKSKGKSKGKGKAKGKASGVMKHLPQINLGGTSEGRASSRDGDRYSEESSKKRKFLI